MDEDAALAAGRTAGLSTLVIGAALLVAPGRVGPLGGITDARNARAVGLVDLALSPGLLGGTPRWPWLAARTVANVRPWITNEYELDGLRESPAVLDRLLSMAKEDA